MNVTLSGVTHLLKLRSYCREGTAVELSPEVAPDLLLAMIEHSSETDSVVSARESRKRWVCDEKSFGKCKWHLGCLSPDLSSLTWSDGCLNLSQQTVATLC